MSISMSFPNQQCGGTNDGMDEDEAEKAGLCRSLPGDLTHLKLQAPIE